MTILTDVKKILPISSLPTKFGEFKIQVFVDNNGAEHSVVFLGEPSKEEFPLVRIHSECLTGDVFSSVRCDCGEQLDYAMERIANAGVGAVVYLRQEGRGIGLESKIRAYNLQDQGMDTLDANLALGHGADEREYGFAAKMLKSLEILSIKLLSNNPLKIKGLEENGILVQREQHEIPYRDDNFHYLKVKANRMGHILNLIDEYQ